MKLQAMERTTDAHKSKLGSIFHEFIHGGEGSSAIMTVGAVVGMGVMGAATGFMTIGHTFAAITFGVGGAALGWYAARHPDGK